MSKVILLLSLSLFFLSCNEISPQGTRNTLPGLCDDRSDKCLAQTKWTIYFKNNTSNLPNNIGLRLFGEVYFDECDTTSTSAFELKSTNPLNLSADNFFSISESSVDIEIFNCDNNSTYYKNPNATYSSSLNSITIAL